MQLNFVKRDNKMKILYIGYDDDKTVTTDKTIAIDENEMVIKALYFLAQGYNVEIQEDGKPFANYVGKFLFTDSDGFAGFRNLTHKKNLQNIFKDK